VGRRVDSACARAIITEPSLRVSTAACMVRIGPPRKNALAVAIRRLFFEPRRSPCQEFNWSQLPRPLSRPLVLVRVRIPDCLDLLEIERAIGVTLDPASERSRVDCCFTDAERCVREYPDILTSNRASAIHPLTRRSQTSGMRYCARPFPCDTAETPS
jgi:hypothetical protein